MEFVYENDDGDECEVDLPTKWEICSMCNGDGKHSRRLGAFTSSEWADEDPDFQESYLAGSYDECCDECDGTGKYRDIDWKAFELLPKEVQEAYENHLKYEADDRATEASERRFGC